MRMNKKCVTFNSSAFCLTNIPLTTFICTVAVVNSILVYFLCYMCLLERLTTIFTV